MDKNGIPIGGTIGFLKSFQKIMRQTRPHEVIICWDGFGGSQRKKQQNKDYKKAAKLYVKAGKAEERMKQTHTYRAFLFYRFASISYNRIGKYKKAVLYGEKTTKYGTQLYERMYLANALDDLGNYYQKLDNYAKAIDSDKQSLDIYYEEVDDSYTIARVAHNIGRSYLDLAYKGVEQKDNYGHAAKYYEIAYNYGYWDVHKDLSDIFMEDALDIIIYYLSNLLQEEEAIDAMLYSIYII